MLSKRYAAVDTRRCAACGQCIQVCKKAAITVPDGCFAVVQTQACAGCGICAKACPADCILIKEREDRNEEKTLV